MEAEEAVVNTLNITEGVKVALIRQGRLSFHLHHRSSPISRPKSQSKASTESESSDKQPKVHSQEHGKALKGAKAKAKKQNETEELEAVAKSANEVLLKEDTVFPFTLFPDTVTVEREKVSIAKRYFFRMAKIVHIPVRDLLHVDAQVGPFFGSVHITSRFFTDKPFEVNFLWRENALKLQRLLQGYIIAHEREIDCTAISKDKLCDLLNDLGGGDTK